MKKRLICFAIAVVMLFSASVCVFAAKPYSVKKYDYYVPIGDSIAAGMEIDCVHSKANNQAACFSRVEGDYVDLVSLATSKPGKDNYHSMVCPGLRTIDVLFLLGLYEGDYDEYIEGARAFSSETTFAAGIGKKIEEKFDFNEYIRNADLITLGLGVNDIATEAFSNAYMAVLAGEADESDFPMLFATNVISGYQTFAKNYEAIIRHILKVNGKKATVVLVGMYNPYSNFNIEGDEYGILKTLFEVMIRSGNALLKTWARKYGFLYADVSDTCNHSENLLGGDIETDGDFQSAALAMASIFTHPDYDGHRYMSECIIDRLPESLKKVSIRTGGLVAKIGNTTVGKFNIARGVNGWTIQDTESGLYVSYKNGKIELASAPTEWQYNGGFYVETAYSVLFIKRTQRVYLGYKNGTLIASLLRQNTELYKAA